MTEHATMRCADLKWGQPGAMTFACGDGKADTRPPVKMGNMPFKNPGFASGGLQHKRLYWSSGCQNLASRFLAFLVGLSCRFSGVRHAKKADRDLKVSWEAQILLWVPNP